MRSENKFVESSGQIGRNFAEVRASLGKPFQSELIKELQVGDYVEISFKRFENWGNSVSEENVPEQKPENVKVEIVGFRENERIVVQGIGITKEIYSSVFANSGKKSVSESESEEPVAEEKSIEKEGMNVSDLTFEQLREARELGLKTYQKIEDGRFLSIEGDEISIGGGNGNYFINNSKLVPGMDSYLLSPEKRNSPLLKKGLSEKEVLDEELEKVILELGNRIVEKEDE